MSELNVDVLVNMRDQLSAKLDQVDSKLDGFAKSAQKAQASTKQTALAANNLATASFALYNAVDRVQDMQVSVNRANLQVKSSLNSVEDAQRRVKTSANELEKAQEAVARAIEESGAESDAAAAAQERAKNAAEKYAVVQDDLKLAQERYGVATERANMMQGNLNEAMFQSALTIIPSVITAATSLTTILTKIKDYDFAELVTKIGGVKAALDGVTASGWAAYSAVGALIGLIAYLGWTTGGPKVERQITGVVPGLPQPTGTTPFGMPSLGLKFNVPPFAEGGIIRRPTLALLGERGPEVVTPLSRAVTQSITIYPTITIYNYKGDEDKKILNEVDAGIVEALRKRAVS